VSEVKVSVSITTSFASVNLTSIVPLLAVPQIIFTSTRNQPLRGIELVDVPKRVPAELPFRILILPVELS